MAFNIEQALKGGIDEFKAERQKCELYFYEPIIKDLRWLKRATDEAGLIIEPRKIECDLHFDNIKRCEKWNIKREINCTVTSKSDLLKGEFISVIIYEGNYITLLNQTGYNEKANIFTYSAETINPENVAFFVEDEEEIEQRLTVDSSLIWFKFCEQFKEIGSPSYCGQEIGKERRLFWEIAETRTVSQPRRVDYFEETPEGVEQKERFETLAVDRVIFYLVNFTTEETFNLLDKIGRGDHELGLYGVIRLPSVKEEIDVQRGFGIRANVKRVDFDINYVIDTTPDGGVKYIEKARLSVLEGV